MKDAIERVLKARRNVIRNSRSSIDQSDTAILEALFDRTRAVKKIGAYKKRNNMMVKDHQREKEVIERLVENGQTLGLDPKLVEDIFTRIIKHSCETQENI